MGFLTRDLLTSPSLAPWVAMSELNEQDRWVALDNYSYSGKSYVKVLVASEKVGACSWDSAGLPSELVKAAAG